MGEGVLARRLVFLIVLLAAVGLAMFGMAPALAHHQSGHGGGPPGSSGGVTEDNDNDNQPNNVEDQGDNWHPSGKDRSVEHGGSGDQGHTQSTPDQDGRGPERDNNGTDQPNGPGGSDIVDQDRNNGCGNDDDFDDDNEGWCGKPSDQPPGGDNPPPGGDNPPPGGDNPPPGGENPPPGGGPPGGEVLPEVVISREARAQAVSVTPAAAPQAAPPAAEELAFTGLDVLPLALLALGLALIGTTLVYVGRRRSVEA